MRLFKFLYFISYFFVLLFCLKVVEWSKSSSASRSEVLKAISLCTESSGHAFSREGFVNAVAIVMMYRSQKWDTLSHVHV